MKALLLVTSLLLVILLAWLAYRQRGTLAELLRLGSKPLRPIGSVYGRNRLAREAAHLNSDLRSKLLLAICALFILSITVAFAALAIVEGLSKAPMGALQLSLPTSDLSDEQIQSLLSYLADSAKASDGGGINLGTVIAASGLGAIIALLITLLRHLVRDAERTREWNKYALSETVRTTILAAILGGSISTLWSAVASSPQILTQNSTDRILIVQSPPASEAEFLLPLGELGVRIPISIIYFQNGDHSISSNYQEHLNELAEALVSCSRPNRPVRLGLLGSASSAPFRKNGKIDEASNELNANLANLRAAAVKAALESKSDAERLAVSLEPASTFDDIIRRQIVLDISQRSPAALETGLLNRAVVVLLLDSAGCSYANR